MADEKYLTVQETSKFLKISISTMNRLVKHNRIPSYKVGHRRLFDKDELVEWVRNQRSEFQGDGCGMKDAISEQSVKSVIDNLECCLCIITGDHELSNGDTCEECQRHELCRNLLDGR